MKRSELIEKLNELVGDDDADIYIDMPGNKTFIADFRIYLDGDGDIVIKL